MLFQLLTEMKSAKSLLDIKFNQTFHLEEIIYAAILPLKSFEQNTHQPAL